MNILNPNSGNIYTNQIVSQEFPKGGIINMDNSFMADQKRVSTAANNMLLPRHTEIGGGAEDYRSKMVYTANVMMGRKRRGQSVVENVNEQSGSKYQLNPQFWNQPRGCISSLDQPNQKNVNPFQRNSVP